MRWRSVAFIGLALVLAYGNPVRIFREIPGDPGDAHLILALLEWGGDRSTQLFSGYWDGPMFSSGRNVMAYTDTFLPLVVPFKALALASGSSVFAFNVLYLASWILCGEATFRLARRYVLDERAAFIGAVAFTFSTIRLSTTNHFQLAWAGLIPLGFLLFFRFREKPTPGRAGALAVVLSAQFLTSAYYGVFLVVGVVGLVAIGLLADVRAGRARTSLAGHATFAAAMAVLFVPVQHWYATAHACAVERRFDVALTALRPGNFLSVGGGSTLLGEAPIVGVDSLASSGENHAYVGLIALAGCLGLTVWVMARRRLPEARGRGIELAAIVLVAVATAGVAAGPLAHPFPVPFELAEAIIPGIDAMGALARLAIFVQLPLCLAAALAIDLVFAGRGRSTILAATAGLVAIVVVEGLSQHPMLDVADVQPGSVYEVLAELEPGVAAELPVPPRGSVQSALIESTRMALGRDNHIQTVNGYSGYVPLGYDRTVGALNSFPMPEAIERLRALGVDYLVLHGAPLDTGQKAVTEMLARDGSFSHLTVDELDSVLVAMPFDLVERQFDASDGVVLVLSNSDRGEAVSSCDET